MNSGSNCGHLIIDQTTRQCYSLQGSRGVMISSNYDTR